MKYFELTCTAYLKDNITFTESFEIISKYISYSMAQDDKLKTIHKSKGFKYYTFGGFLPIEKEKIYSKSSTYKFTIRSIDKSFMDTLSIELRKNINNPYFLIVETNKKIVKQFFVTELYSATPVISTMPNGRFWMKEDDLMLLYEQLQNNLERKYQGFYNEKIESSQNFIQLLELKNNRSQSIQITKNSKKTRLFGNKFKIVPYEDEVSQKLAFLALGCGLGEKNSFGGGFCLGKGIVI